MNSQMEQSRDAKADTKLDTLLFVHIPKTAGMTFHAILSQLYDPYDYCAVYPNWPHSKEVIKSIPWNGRLRVMAGHFTYGLHDDPEAKPLMEENVRYTTFLRDPVDRVVSHYNHIMNSDHPSHRELFARYPTLEDFLEHPWARDAQVCFLTGWHRTIIKSDKAEALRVANQLLRDRFEVVGLTERFDESLLLFAEAFGWRLPTYTSTNLASERAKRLHVEDLSPSLIDRIKNFNRCDVPMYEYACSLFEERRKAISSFQSKLGEHRSRVA